MVVLRLVNSAVAATRPLTRRVSSSVAAAMSVAGLLVVGYAVVGSPTSSFANVPGVTQSWGSMPQPQNGSIAGHIYLCKSGTPTTTEVPGGTLAATGPQSLSATANPLGPMTVKAGDYTMSAVAPSGYTFVPCGTDASIGSPPTSATEPVTVPKCHTGTAVFYVVATTATNITLTVTKANDANGSGVFAETESTSAPEEDVAFQVVVTNTSSVAVTLISLTDSWPGRAPFSPICAPAVVGTTLAPGASVTCGFTLDSYAPAPGGSLTDTVVVGGCQATNTGNCTQDAASSTVSTSSTPVSQSISVTVLKVNDAYGSGTYAQTETALSAGADVPFDVVVTNTSPAAVTIISLTDGWPGKAPFSPSCTPPVVGTTLAPGASVTCRFTLDGYAPGAGRYLTDTATATVCQATDSANCASASATSTVKTAPAATTAAAHGLLAFTGPPAHVQLMFGVGVGVASAGSFFLLLARSRRKTVSRP
jgi:hypothetical protein